jgi:hypothetical protein
LARNLRANAAAKLGVGSWIERIEGHELKNEEEKASVVLAICRKYPSVFRRYFKVDPKQVTLEQARELATRYPVFAIEIAAVDRVQATAEADDAPTSMREASRTSDATLPPIGESGPMGKQLPSRYEELVRTSRGQALPRAASLLSVLKLRMVAATPSFFSR